ncbi:MAG: ABC transporter ATP-binding protein [Armatimonadota bacterium]|nr:ABC transporter ATP-binding protein [Armatimonadota bacterium]MDR7450580.1 ABC transporter ATP-binding protein [Armatimonadota bacterium]MDR7466287.1 ABC transporter ATP-binding protein [Armatimonadota bacterium]MDR7493008.1 ABC transporter ATP-binding protein [Armatimonadota bacterium]MDR7498235.1 ABC transporter ATP-binding protein [Armatimonadota bacterium]
MSSASRPAGSAPPLLLLKEITKQFPGVVANDRVTVDVQAGEVHALLGENGAGKTTLVKVLYGIHQPDAGEILLRGRPVRIRAPRDALRLGIGMVPQHFLLVRRHTVAENVCLGLEGTPALFPARQVERRIRELGDRYGLVVDPRAPVWSLSISEQQRVEILKALMRGAEILVLDEPTSVLTPQEAQGLFAVMRRMTEEGHAVIFITHKLDEVLAVADRITVLRKGRVVETLAAGSADKRLLARMMVGRDVEFRLTRAPAAPRGEGLRLEEVWALNDRGLPALRGASFTVQRGEIVGVAGVAGNGQRELVEVITGLRRILRGRVWVLGRDVTNGDARMVLETGAAHIPEERMRAGIVGAMSVAENLVLRRYREAPFSRGPLLNPQAIHGFALRMMSAYGIAAPSPRAPARTLSGGNVQRLILARELSGEPGLVIAAHPTSGLDISATEQIHTLLLRRREEGAGILLVSEDLDEILTLSDRIVVMFGGQVVAVVPAAEADRERIGLMMTGQRP